MSQFVVPQFIDVEDKILGPITTRQFAILMITALVMFIIYKLVYIWYAIAVDVILLGSALVVAFVRINGQLPPPPPAKVYKEAPTTSRLSELALIVNTGGVYRPEE